MNKLDYNFGKLKVSKKDKTILVQNLFSRVTNKYDYMNDLMSFGTHRIWKKKLVDFMNIQDDDIILDAGTGTGDIANYIRRKNNKAKIYLGDLNFEMMNYGKKIKYKNTDKLDWINLNCEELPFEEEYFDKYVIAFCIRNVTNIEKTLLEALRVLKTNGEFYCMEFSGTQAPLQNSLFKIYKSKFIPFLGKYFANDKKAYKYLGESIDNFPQQDIFKEKLLNVGFNNISYINLLNGIVSIHKGFKT